MVNALLKNLREEEGGGGEERRKERKIERERERGVRTGGEEIESLHAHL